MPYAVDLSRLTYHGLRQTFSDRGAHIRDQSSSLGKTRHLITKVPEPMVYRKEARPMFAMSRSLRGLLWCAPLLLGCLRAQSVSITPSSASVGVGFNQQFTANVTGLSNTAVTWSVANKGAGNANVG